MFVISSHSRVLAISFFCAILFCSSALGIAGTAPLNLNQATAAQLATLPGIGPELAERIIEYKKANGKFQSVDELANVKGIGEKKLTKFKDAVTVKKSSKQTP